MSDDLKEILKRFAHSDAADSDSIETDGLIEGVYREVARRHRVRRRTVMAVCVGMLFVGGVWGMSRFDSVNDEHRDRMAGRQQPRVDLVDATPKLSEQELNNELAELKKSVERLHEHLDALAMIEKNRPSTRRATREDQARVALGTVAAPDIQAALAAETAAQSMLYRGQMLGRSEQTNMQARASYQRVIDVFPQTEAANLARQQLQTKS